jgi:hypothetical protein
MPRTLQERTAIVAGMRAAQAAGKHVGRPPPKAWRLAKLRRLLRDEPDISWNALAKRVRILTAKMEVRGDVAFDHAARDFYLGKALYMHFWRSDP